MKIISNQCIRRSKLKVGIVLTPASHFQFCTAAVSSSSRSDLGLEINSIMANISRKFLVACVAAIVFVSLKEVEASGPGLQVAEEVSFFEDIGSGPIKPKYDLPHDYRLPKGLIPDHYIVNIRPILDAEEAHGEVDTAPGDVQMVVRCVEDTQIVTFHSNQIEIDYASIKIESLDGSTTLMVESHSEDHEFQIVELQMAANEQLRAGTTYTISLNFEAKIPRSLLGMYHRTYRTHPEYEEKKLVLTKLEAIGARMVFPCFDEPALKATYQFNIAHTAKYNTLCNMEKIGEPTEDPDLPGWFWDAYDTTEKMSTYLIAIVVSEFTSVEATAGIYDKPVKTWGAKFHLDVGAGLFAADETAKVLKYFTELYDLAYPFPKMDSAAIPEFSSGAMEQWGLITYRDDYLLYFPGISTEADRFQVSRIIAHEVAHQWFGNIVTLEWWNNLWLNEGFARYIEKVGVDHTNPEFDANLFTVSTARVNALVADAGATTKPVHYNGDNLSGIVYDKASFLIRMMEAFLTKETFLKGLQVYLKNHLYGNAIQDDLFEQLTITGHADGTLNPSVTMKSIMDSWTRQTGFPLVRVGRVAGDRIYFSQERFGSTPPIIDTEVLVPSQLWTIPMSFASTGTPDFSPANQRPKTWLDKTSTFGTFALTTANDDWVVANVDASAYYRVIYDDHLTATLKAQLDRNAKAIGAASRSQIIDDHFKSAFERYIRIQTALDFTAFLDQEDTLVVWQTFFTNFRPSYTRLNGHSKHAEEFKKYISGKLEGALNLVGVKQLPAEKGVKVLVRVQLLDWACSLGLDICTDYAKELFQQWVATPHENPVPVDIRSTMYCAMVWSGGVVAKDFILDKYASESQYVVWPYLAKPVFKNALACASEDAVINELLELSIAGGITPVPKPDALDIVIRMAASSSARPKVIEFLQANLPAIIQYHSVNGVRDIVAALVPHWSEFDKVDQLNKFISDNAVVLESVLPALRNSVRAIETNFKWMVDFGNDMGDWFVGQNEEDETTPKPVDPETTVAEDPTTTSQPGVPDTTENSGLRIYSTSGFGLCTLLWVVKFLY